MQIRIIFKFFEKYKYSGIAFFLQNSRNVSNEQSYLKPTGLYDDLLLLSSLFYFLYFIFSAPISFGLCTPVSPSLSFFFDVLSQPLSSVVEKLLYTYIKTCITYYITIIIYKYIKKDFLCGCCSIMQSSCITPHI